jgi:hypothetical protein
LRRKRHKPTTTAAAKPRVVLRPPGASRQVSFHQLLVAARKRVLLDALSEALGVVDPAVIKDEISQFIPAEVQKTLAAMGIRDEFVFPLPAVIKAKPTLVGYYRLLLGAPQKSFYKGSTGMGMFKSMEELGTLSTKQEANVPAFCAAMASSLCDLVRQIPSFSTRDLRELPLLTFGSQLQGSNNTLIGKKAMQEVFLAVSELLGRHVVKKEGNRLAVKNSAGRIVHITLSHDPDVSVQEEVGGRVHNKVAIEVKGGTDVSNVHNRAGEAEKSHLKAKKKGFIQFWTIISKAGADVSKLMQESQTTNEWFDITEILSRAGPDWDEFRQHFAGAVGIPLHRKQASKRT